MRWPTLSRVTSASDALDRLTALVPGFPEPGVLFRDLTPVLADADALHAVAAELAASAEEPYDAIAGVEARGFALAAAAAAVAGSGLVLIRKAGKLPRPVFRREYALEYGTAALELHRDELPAGSRVLLVDDVLATGGTLEAALGLLADASLEVAGVSVALELAALGGRARLGRADVRAISVVE
jgi:adenine phosphoribosyltransferase